MTEFAIIEIVRNLAPVLGVAVLGSSIAAIIGNVLKYRNNKSDQEALDLLNRRMERIEEKLGTTAGNQIESRIQNLEDIVITKEIER
ncbi:MAG: hypothetical protein ACLFR1_06290 [Spirochaetia bacterium]